MSTESQTIPTRKDVPQEDRWDLSKLYTQDSAWDADIQIFRDRIQQVTDFQGHLAESASTIRACLTFLKEMGILEERLGHYAFLRFSEDASDPENQSRQGLMMKAESAFSAAASYIEPELLSIPEETMRHYLATEELAEFSIMLNKMLRFRAHILSPQEERLLALQAEAADTAHKAFSALTDVDLDFGHIETPEGTRPLSQSTFSSFMLHPDRALRKSAYDAFYGKFLEHSNTLSALYSGSVLQDVYRAKVRNFGSARQAALFPDNVPESVYDSLITSVHDALPSLHTYYHLRKEVLGLDELHHYDVYVPLVSDIQTHTTYEEAVEIISKALAPLGEEYVTTLTAGLTKGWVDKYENRGKRSGAFSAGSFVGDPYILMNYKEDVLRDVFTLAHEGGHSMHSWYSTRSNPFQHYHYTIFEAEVASTFNEQFIADYLISKAETPEMRAYIIGKQIDDIIATIFRQTMFAEYESIVHALSESGVPLTVKTLRDEYRTLLMRYFGPSMVLDEKSDLEGLRIPHFYRAFYVYKYATGLSAAIALFNQVKTGGEEARLRYLRFLSSGGSKFPIDSLREAGVDMSSPEPVQSALSNFSVLVEEFKNLLKK